MFTVSGPVTTVVTLLAELIEKQYDEDKLGAPTFIIHPAKARVTAWSGRNFSFTP